MKAMPTKHAKGAKGVKERMCQRCGCTASRACPGGCAWVLNTDVCDRCLTDVENTLGMMAELLRSDTQKVMGIVEALKIRAQMVENLLCVMLRKPAPRAKKKGRR